MSEKTKAPIGAPARSTRAGFFGALTEAPTMVPSNMQDGETRLKDMTFKIEIDWHTWFKTLSAQKKMSMKDIFKEAVEEWAERRRG